MDLRESILLAVKALLQKGYEWLACDADGTIIGASDRDIYADNQKLDIDKALREGVHPQAIRDFLGGADYDGDTTNS